MTANLQPTNPRNTSQGLKRIAISILTVLFTLTLINNELVLLNNQISAQIHVTTISCVAWTNPVDPEPETIEVTWNNPVDPEPESIEVVWSNPVDPEPDNALFASSA